MANQNSLAEVPRGALFGTFSGLGARVFDAWAAFHCILSALLSAQLYAVKVFYPFSGSPT
jgi:hypothetical protein